MVWEDGGGNPASYPICELALEDKTTVESEGPVQVLAIVANIRGLAHGSRNMQLCT